MNAHDELSTRLNQELHDRVDSMHDSPLGFSEVRAKARSIRRRRTAIAVVAAAAAVAVIVPTAAVASHHLGGTSHSLPPATQDVSPSPTPSTASADPSEPPTGQQPAAGVLDVSDLPTGGAPQVDYLYDGRLHLTDGGSGRLNTRYPADQFVEMDDGSRVWHTADNGTPYIEIQDADGTFHDPVRSDWGLSVNPKHTISAWLAPAGQVIVWEARASDPRPLGDPVPGFDLRLGPVSGDACSLACSVEVDVRDATSQPWEVDDSGSRPLRDGGYLTVSDMSAAGLSIGLTKVTNYSTCSKLLGGGEFQGFATCKNQLSTFSPDGRLIVGLPSYFDGLGPGAISMYDLIGQRLFERGATLKTQAYVSGAGWEDDTHLLAPVYQDGKWSLVRFASDGTMEYAVPPVKGPYDSSPYVLPTHPLNFGA